MADQDLESLIVSMVSTGFSFIIGVSGEGSSAHTFIEFVSPRPKYKKTTYREMKFIANITEETNKLAAKAMVEHFAG